MVEILLTFTLNCLATCFIHIVAIIMTIIMIYHIRSKYTAVGTSYIRWSCHAESEIGPPGRKEIVMFFYLYAIIELLAIFLDSNVIPTANASYPVCILPQVLAGRAC